MMMMLSNSKLKLKAGLRNIQSCHLLSRTEPFMRWLANAFLTNSI